VFAEIAHLRKSFEDSMYRLKRMHDQFLHTPLQPPESDGSVLRDGDQSETHMRSEDEFQLFSTAFNSQMSKLQVRNSDSDEFKPHDLVTSEQWPC
jgi:hypothetical protein